MNAEHTIKGLLISTDDGELGIRLYLEPESVTSWDVHLQTYAIPAIASTSGLGKPVRTCCCSPELIKALHDYEGGHVSIDVMLKANSPPMNDTLRHAIDDLRELYKGPPFNALKVQSAYMGSGGHTRSY